jgi:competence protein ComEA
MNSTYLIKGISHMKNLITSLALILATSSVGFAQLAAPVAPTAPKPPMSAPVAPAAPIVPAAPVVKAPVVATPAPVVSAPATTTKAAPANAAKTAPVNLNTATVEQLDALPQIGAARAKAIIEARAKGKFKDWADFEARNVVPKNAEAAIKDKVFF